LSNNSNTDEIAKEVIKIIKERKPQNIVELLDFLKQEFSASNEILLKVILIMESEQKISLCKASNSVSTNFSKFMKTKQVTWYWSTLIIEIAIIVVFFLLPENIYPLNYFRSLLGMILIFWLVGFTSIKVLIPSGTHKNLDFIERFALSLGMSLALTPLIGLILNYSPFGIREGSITISLLTVVTILATVGVFREFTVKSVPTVPTS
jgi:hypothetical protein